MTAAKALARTVLLARKDLLDTVSDDEILDGLTSLRVMFVANQENLSSSDGQHAFVAAVTLVARSGATCFIDAPNQRLRGVHPLLRRAHIVDALLELGEDLVPGQRISAARPRGTIDLLVALGDSRSNVDARQQIALSASRWEGRVGNSGERFTDSCSPFGALAAAALAAGEAYKHAMRRLRRYAAHDVFDDFFRETPEARVAFALGITPPPPALLCAFDTVSGGAIVQSALYALCKIPGVTGHVRVIEPDVNAISNVNRYALLRRADLGDPKAPGIAQLGLGGLQITPLVARYDRSFGAQHRPLASEVLVGVDNVESRWAVQDESANWIGVGATEEYSAFRTLHEQGLPCVRCLHPDGVPPAGEIPTAAFVSFWGGLSLAAAFALHRLGVRPRRQVLQLSCLQLGSNLGVLELPGIARPSCRCAGGVMPH